MDSLIFHVDADKVGPNLIESIKAYFGNRRVQIVVKTEDAEGDLTTDGQVEDRDYALPYDDVARIAEALERNEPVDVVAEMHKFMGLQQAAQGPSTQPPKED